MSSLVPLAQFPSHNALRRIAIRTLRVCVWIADEKGTTCVGNTHIAVRTVACLVAFVCLVAEVEVSRIQTCGGTVRKRAAVAGRRSAIGVSTAYYRCRAVRAVGWGHADCCCGRRGDGGLGRGTNRRCCALWYDSAISVKVVGLVNVLLWLWCRSAW